MRPHSSRRWLVCLGLMLGLVLRATPTAQQCYLDISAYASGVVTGYDANGNGVLGFAGSGFDYSWCEGQECAHVYAIAGIVKQQPSQQEWANIEGGGTEFSSSVTVTPGEYKVESLFYVGCWICAQQTFITQAAQVVQVPQTQPPSISGPNELWWFNGVSPSGYATSIVLNSSGGAGTAWAITAGSGIVSLSTNQGASVTVTGVGQSANANDVTITATTAAGSGNHQLTVRSPYRLEAGQIVTTCPQSPWGYTTTLRYTIRDNLGSTLPTDVPISENWTSGVTNIFTGTNWRRGDPAGVVIAGGIFDDRIEGEHEALPPNPDIQCGNSTGVQNWGQEWSVGSVTPGQGKSVQTNTLNKQRGYASHSSIVTPP